MVQTTWMGLFRGGAGLEESLISKGTYSTYRTLLATSEARDCCLFYQILSVQST